MKKQLRIGLIGYSFMGRAHSNAFHQVNHFFPSAYELVPQAVCGRDAAAVQAFADKWGYKSIETDWRKLLERDDIDVIDIATPNNMHAEQAIAAGPWSTLILRPAAIYGPGRGVQVSLPLGEYHPGENFVSRIHADDLAGHADRQVEDRQVDAERPPAAKLARWRVRCRTRQSDAFPRSTPPVAGRGARLVD